MCSRVDSVHRCGCHSICLRDCCRRTIGKKVLRLDNWAKLLIKIYGREGSRSCGRSALLSRRDFFSTSSLILCLCLRLSRLHMWDAGPIGSLHRVHVQFHFQISDLFRTCRKPKGATNPRRGTKQSSLRVDRELVVDVSVGLMTSLERRVCKAQDWVDKRRHTRMKCRDLYPLYLFLCPYLDI